MEGHTIVWGKSQWKSRTPIIDGYAFNKEKFGKKGQAYWRCYSGTKVRCSVRVHTKGDEIVKFMGQHNHEPNPQLEKKRSGETKYPRKEREPKSKREAIKPTVTTRRTKNQPNLDVIASVIKEVKQAQADDLDLLKSVSDKSHGQFSRDTIVNVLLLSHRYHIESLKTSAINFLITERQKDRKLELKHLPNYEALVRAENHDLVVELLNVSFTKRLGSISQSLKKQSRVIHPDINVIPAEPVITSSNETDTELDHRFDAEEVISTPDLFVGDGSDGLPPEQSEIDNGLTMINGHHFQML